VHDDEDRDLLRSWRQGDASAGDVLVRRHFRSVHRFFRNKVDGDIDDLIQKTFLGCAEAIGRFREDARFNTFLLGIARNQLLLHYRAGAQARKRPVVELSVRELGITASPSVVLAERQEQRILLAALRELPLDQQIAIELFYWEGLSVSDVAAVLEIAPGTVKSRLARGREALREAITSMDVAEELRSRTCNDLERWARSLHAPDRE
jgi:RNA polymerase sigma factor (sigma-70 family)